MKNICVYCSSSDALEKKYFDEAAKLGKLIAQNKFNLVYGGAKVGLMGEVARSVTANNGNVIGIIPEIIKDRELAYLESNELIVTKDLRERKRLMAEKADAFIALPGGFGTLDEIMEMITLKQLNLHSKPIIFINTDGFFFFFSEFFDSLVEKNVIKKEYTTLYYFAENPEEALNFIENYAYSANDSKWYNVNFKN